MLLNECRAKLILNEWQHKHLEFAEAIEEGKETVDAAVEGALLSCALGGSSLVEKIFCRQNGAVIRMQVKEHTPPDIEVIQIWLCTHMPDVYG